MIAILTAIEDEYQAVRAHLSGVRTHSHEAKTSIDVGHLTGRPQRKVALVCTGPGNLAAATLTERVISTFKPTALMFVGIAGGLREWTELGDVVVATKVYAYHGGRTEGADFLGRPRAWELAHVLDQAARKITRSFDWRASLPDEGQGSAPTVHLGPVAAGDILHDSPDSAAAELLRTRFEDAIAVDMESAGFALAGHLNGSVPTVTVRAISDRANGTKATAHRDGWHPIAARNAAAFAAALAAALDVPDDEQETESTPAAPPAFRNSNTAKGHARVGQMIGINHGANYLGTEPTGGSR